MQQQPSHSISSSSHNEKAGQQEIQPMVNIMGEKVALGPFHRGILPFFYKWLNDFEVTILSGDQLAPKTMEDIQEQYDREAKSAGQYQVIFIIYERVSMRIIGLVELRRINRTHCHATFGIMIGEKDCWGKGYGTEATRLILDYGFTVLNLHNIMLTTYSYNVAAQRAYTKAGFRVIGTRRQMWRWQGQLYDEVLMECLSTEFERPATALIKLP